VRTRSRVIWAVLWLSGAFLFALVLLRPGLATAQDGSTAWMLATSGTFAGVALAIWRFYARRTVDQRPSPPGAQDLDDDRRPQHGTPF
jgi:membrane associated rhomboid family serine protease